MKVAGGRGLIRSVSLGAVATLWLAGLPLLGGAPAFAQWGDGYQQPGGGSYYEAPPRPVPPPHRLASGMLMAAISTVWCWRGLVMRR